MTSGRTAALLALMLWFGANTAGAQDSLSGGTIADLAALTDHHGRPVDIAGFEGKYPLIFFGYTFCPDICPTGLQTMAEALDALGSEATAVAPVFVTVDPERDTVAVIADYVDAFHPRLSGITGSAKDIRKAAKKFGVRYFKLFLSPLDDDEEDAFYTVSHSANTYLLGPRGRPIAIFPHGMSSAELATRLGTLIAESR